MNQSPLLPAVLPGSRSPRRSGRYGHFGIRTDPAEFGLQTSEISTPVGSASVTHGRRSGRADAVAIILLHGAAGSWSTFTPLLAAAETLDVDLRDLIIPDLPGWGGSALPLRPPTAASRPSPRRSLSSPARSATTSG